MRLEAFFTDFSDVISSRFISGTIDAKDGVPTPLTFADDGTEGDTTAHDGIYTARFYAPDLTGRDANIPIVLYGEATNVARYARVTLVVKP